MKIRSIASGSGGNCVYVETEKTRILIDAGYSARQIEHMLKAVGIDARSLNAILVTHEHGDHVQGVGVLSRRFHIPVYANARTWNAMARRVGKIAPSMQQAFRNRRRFFLRDLEIEAIPIHHDAADPVGFTIQHEDQRFSLITDTGILDENIMDAIAGSDIYYFEANHDVDMLVSGSYPEPLKERILSARGHLSNLQSARALAELLEGRNEVVLLAHMSTENNEELLCRDTIANVLWREGLDPDRSETILVAPRMTASPLFDCSAGHAENVQEGILL